MIPKRGQLYTLTQVLKELELRDSPFLGVFVDDSGHRYPIQDSHIVSTNMLSIEGFADTKWEYRYETAEWIPIFQYAKDNPPITDFVDYEPAVDWDGNQEDGFWVTPKGFPRQQYRRE